MSDEELKRLAARIAEDLFTDGAGRRADRLQLMHRKGVDEFPGGGWSEGPAGDAIYKVLRRNIK